MEREKKGKLIEYFVQELIPSSFYPYVELSMRWLYVFFLRLRPNAWPLTVYAFASVYLFFSVSVCLSVCLAVCLFVHLFACLAVCLCVFLSVCLSVCLQVCLSVCRSVCLSVCLQVCLSARLSADLFVCLRKSHLLVHILRILSFIALCHVFTLLNKAST